MLFEKETETFNRELPTLMASAGKFALVKGEEVAGVFDTFEDAIKAGYDRYKLEPFMVKKIAASDQVHHFTRNLGPCLT